MVGLCVSCTCVWCASDGGLFFRLHVLSLIGFTLCCAGLLDCLCFCLRVLFGFAF